jgi:hypothetical protein
VFEELPWQQGVLARLNGYHLFATMISLLRALPLHAAFVHVPPVVVYPDPNLVLGHAGTDQGGEDQTNWSSTDHGDSQHIAHGNHMSFGHGVSFTRQALIGSMPVAAGGPCRSQNLVDFTPETPVPVSSCRNAKRPSCSPHNSRPVFSITIQCGLYGAANRPATGKVLVCGT